MKTSVYRSEAANALVDLLSAIAVWEQGDGKRAVGIPNLAEFLATYDAATAAIDRQGEWERLEDRQAQLRSSESRHRP